MCKALKICRSTYYYEVNVVRKAEKEAQEHLLTESIISIFNKSRKRYGPRKIREALRTEGLVVSRRKIIKIMQVNGLISLYNKARYKHKNADLVLRLYLALKAIYIVYLCFIQIKEKNLIMNASKML